MSTSDDSTLDSEIIDITPRVRRRAGRPGRFKWIIIALLATFFILWRGIYIYVESLWYGSLGFASRFWYVVELRWGLFLVFGVVTFAILRGGFYVLEKWFSVDKIAPRTIYLDKRPVEINVFRYLRPIGWGVAIFFGLIFGLSYSADWNIWVLFLDQPPTAATDPIFGRTIGFYLFSLPVYDLIAGWLLTIGIILSIATLIFGILSIVPAQVVTVEEKRTTFQGFGEQAYAAISIALAVLMVLISVDTFLSRYEYLSVDHQSFSGVTFSEANYLIPGLTIVAVSLLVSAAILVFNSVSRRGVKLLAVAVGIPVVVYIVAAAIVPAYVQNFIVKPNELGRETPYIEHNIAGTRTAFNIENVEPREYAADITPDSLNIAANQTTMANIRLWDWQALQDTLRQIQEIRTYYDFPDVDVDRYRTGGELRQVMVAARELDVNKLPEQSRNWINERLVYTHGYGLTMNPVNEFTSEGKPRFIMSNMPVETSDIRVTRPEIYFGESTNTLVYVNTKQPEFDYPQGESNKYTTYQGDGGFAVGGGLRRLAIAWATGDLTKLPFSDDVTSESRVLMYRNIVDRITRIAPFFTYDTDPYIMVNDDGRLVWIVDGYSTSNAYPYSRHYDNNGKQVNYIRNSVKVTIDAYTGAVSFYVFDDDDPIVAAYRHAFPELFKPAAEMPAGVRAHIRYPELMMKTQSDVYGLYHSQSAKVFFGREDVWSIARDAVSNTSNASAQSKSDAEPFDPYQVLMPLPGENAQPEFARVIPFTPGNRNNMIAWMAGRSDGDAYGKLLVYAFPASRVIDGPLQIEARIDQDAQIAGQITLWNQQGSKVKRGNLIIMPIGTGLLFVEPIYLQAVRSPMPELRLVVLATQERLTYAENFDTALKQLLGQTQKTAAKETETAKTGEKQPAAPSSADDLIKKASQAFADYQRLTSEGKLAEAGQKLDELKQALNQLQNQQK
jgi:uncharacterized membrane protein (UPF0182 family)